MRRKGNTAPAGGSLGRIDVFGAGDDHPWCTLARAQWIGEPLGDAARQLGNVDFRAARARFNLAGAGMGPKPGLRPRDGGGPIALFKECDQLDAAAALVRRMAIPDTIAQVD
jgi:hypothetical protein